MKNLNVYSATAKFLSICLITSFTQFLNAQSKTKSPLSVLEAHISEFDENEIIKTSSDLAVDNIKNNNSNHNKIKYKFSDFSTSHPEEGKIKLKGKPESVELTEKRSLQSRTFLNKDGSKSNVSYSRPIHYSENGNFLSIDNTIEYNSTLKHSDYSYVNSKNTLKTYFPTDFSLGFVTDIDNHSLKDMISPRFYYQKNGQEFLSTNFSNSSAIVAGDKITYENVYPNVDMVVTIQNGRRKADYIIKNSSFLNQSMSGSEDLVFEETILLPNGWSASLNDNIISISDNHGTTKVYYDVPRIFDNAQLSQSPLSNQSLNNSENFSKSIANYEISTNGTTVTLKTKVSTAWLFSSDRVFPLTIDPDLTGTSGTVLTAGGSLTMTTSGAGSNDIITNVSLVATESYYSSNIRIWFNCCGSYNWTSVSSYAPMTLSNSASVSLGAGTTNTTAQTNTWSNLSNFNNQSPNATWTVSDGGSLAHEIEWDWVITVSYTTGSSTTPGLWTGTTSTDWNTAGNWDDGAVPTSSVNVTIPTGCSNYPSLSANNHVCQNLTIQSGGSITSASSSAKLVASIITLNNGGTMTISDGEIESTGKMDCDGALVMSGSGVLDVNGEFEMSSTTTESITGGTIYCEGVFDGLNCQAFNPTGGTVVLEINTGTGTTISPMSLGNNTAVSSTFGGTSHFYNLTIDDGYVYPLDGYSTCIKNDLTLLNAGSIDVYGQVYLEGDLVTGCSGTTSYSSSGCGRFTTGYGTCYLILTGSADQSIGSLNANQMTVIIEKSSGTVTQNGYFGVASISVGWNSSSTQTGTYLIDDETVELTSLLYMLPGTLQVNGGTLNYNANSSANVVVQGGTLDVDAGEVNIGRASDDYWSDINMVSGTIDVSGGTLNICDELDQADGTITQSGGTINIGTYTGSSDPSTVDRFEMEAGTLNLTAGTLNIKGQNASASSDAIDISSSVTVNSNANHTIVLMDGAGSSDEDMYINCSSELGNLTISNSSFTTSILTPIDLKGNCSISSGATLSLGGQSLNLEGNLDVTGTLSANSRTITFDGDGSVTCSSYSDNTADIDVSKTNSGDVTFGTTTSIDQLEITTASTVYIPASATFTASGSTTLTDGTLSIGNATFNADGSFSGGASNTIDFTDAAGRLILSGTVGASVYSGTLDDAMGTVEYDGSSAQTMFTNDYYNIEIDGSATKSLGGNTTVKGDITLTAGELDFAGGRNLNLIGDMTKTSGALVNSSSTNGYLVLKATSSQNASQAVCGFTAPSVSIKVQQSADVEITGDISANYLWVQTNNSGTFTIDNNFNLTVDQYIKVAGGTLNVVTGSLTTTQNSSVNHELSGGILDIDGGTVSFGSSSDNTTDLNIDGGTLDISGGTLNVSDCIDITTGTFTQSGGIVNVKTNTDVNGDSDHKFAMDAGTLNLTDGTMNLLGETNNATYYSMSIAAGVTTTSTSSHTISISTNDASGDEDRYIDLGDASNDIGNLTFDLTGHELYFKSNTDILGNLTATNGDIDVSSYTINVAGNAAFTNDDLLISTGILDVEGTFNSPNNTTFSDAGRLQLAGTVSSLGTMTSTVGTVEYDASGAQDVLADTYFNLEVDGSGVKTLPTSNITVNGDLSLTAGSLAYNSGSSSKLITLKGSVLGTGTITATTSSIFKIDGDGTNQDIRGISSDDIGVRLSGSANATTSGDISAKYLDLLSGSTGTFTIDGETFTISPSSGYLEMDGGNLTVSGGSLINNSTSETTNELDAGTLTVSGGTVTFTGNSSSNTGGDLNVDGGTLTVSSGSISINDELDMGSGIINQSGGAIYVDAGTNNSNGTNAHKFDVATGSLNLSGGAIYVQSQSSSSYNCINIASGVSASIESNHTFDIGTNSTAKNMYFNFGGHSIGCLNINLPAKNAYFSEDLNILGNVNIINGTLVVDTYNPSVAGSTTISGTLKIGAGSYDANGTFDASSGTIDFNNGNGQLYVSNSTVTSFGSLDNATGTVVYDGTSAQTIDEAETFYSLKVDNASGVTLNAIATVGGTLTLGNGMINSSSTNPLALSSPVTITAASSTSHINGAARLVSSSTTEQVLPVGDGTNYRPVIIEPENSTASTYTAEFKNTPHSSITYDGNGANTTSCASGVDHVAGGVWWDIERSSGGSDAYVALNWESGMGIDVPNDIILSHYNSTTTEWETLGANITGSNGSGTASASDGRVRSSSYVTDFSPFNLGSGTGDNPLPIDLLSFDVNCVSNYAEINFSVMSQVNNDYFVIERSSDAEQWSVVETIEGAGNSNTQMDYMFTDQSPLPNISYYRLTQVDYDGQYKTYYPVSANCGSYSDGIPVSIYPNPSSDEVTVELDLDEFQGEDVYYTLTDATGKVVMSDYIMLERGYNKHKLNVNRLTKGIYILRFNQTRDHITETRIVKK